MSVTASVEGGDLRAPATPWWQNTGKTLGKLGALIFCDLIDLLTESDRAPFNGTTQKLKSGVFPRGYLQKAPISQTLWSAVYDPHTRLRHQKRASGPSDESKSPGNIEFC